MESAQAKWIHRLPVSVDNRQVETPKQNGTGWKVTVRVHSAPIHSSGLSIVHESDEEWENKKGPLRTSWTVVDKSSSPPRGF